MIRIGICDDNPQALAEIAALVQDAAAAEGIAQQCRLYTSSQFLLWDVLEKKEAFDLLLLDIEMPQVSGTDLSRQLGGLLPSALVIFITDHMRYVLDAFELSAFRYIPKAELQSRLPRALADAARCVESRERRNLVVRWGSTVRHIPCGSILYIDKTGKNCRLHTEDGIQPVRRTLGEIMAELDADAFLYLDRGIIANLEKIHSIEGSEAVLFTGERLPVSRKRLPGVRQKLAGYWGRRL